MTSFVCVCGVDSISFVCFYLIKFLTGIMLDTVINSTHHVSQFCTPALPSKLSQCKYKWNDSTDEHDIPLIYELRPVLIRFKAGFDALFDHRSSNLSKSKLINRRSSADQLELYRISNEISKICPRKSLRCASFLAFSLVSMQNVSIFKNYNLLFYYCL